MDPKESGASPRRLCYTERLMKSHVLTQMTAARQGRVTPEMEQVLREEPVTRERLLADLSAGRVVIPANRVRASRLSKGIGAGLRTKVNVNLGVSPDRRDVEMEMEKARLAQRLGADALMDLSLDPDSALLRRRLLKEIPLPLGTVPIYDAPWRFKREFEALTPRQMFETIEAHAADGVDFMTVHAGLTRAGVERLRVHRRLTHVVSRGGALLLSWMEGNRRENPFYEAFDRLLAICAHYDVTISLGDGLRPGSLHDAGDGAQVHELILLGELAARAWEKGVQVMIEGPGHVPLHQIEAQVVMAKTLTHGAPLYVLGPLVTDVAPGYDHITSAIGGALAARAGADFLCYVTPAEHLRLPDPADVREGLVAARIAAHAGDIAKGIPGAREWDDAMSASRGALDWTGMEQKAMDPEKVRAYRASSPPSDRKVCTMCGPMCAMKRSRNALCRNAGRRGRNAP